LNGALTPLPSPLDALQSLSTPSQISAAPGLIEAAPSLQSPALATYPAGAEQALVGSAALPKLSASASR
jgi:hypothetical protein